MSELFSSSPAAFGCRRVGSSTRSWIIGGGSIGLRSAAFKKGQISVWIHLRAVMIGPLTSDAAHPRLLRFLSYNYIIETVRIMSIILSYAEIDGEMEFEQPSHRVAQPDELARKTQKHHGQNHSQLLSSTTKRVDRVDVLLHLSVKVGHFFGIRRRVLGKGSWTLGLVGGRKRALVTGEWGCAWLCSLSIQVSGPAHAPLLQSGGQCPGSASNPFS